MTRRILPLAIVLGVALDIAGLPVSSWMRAIAIPFIGVGLLAVIAQADRVGGMLVGVGMSIFLASMLLPLIGVMSLEVMNEEIFQIVVVVLAAAVVLPPIAKATFAALTTTSKAAAPRLSMKRRAPLRGRPAAREEPSPPPVVDVLASPRSRRR
jgi:hypothetical protein